MHHRVLVTDDVDAEGVAVLRAEPTFDVEEMPTLPAAELLARIADYDAIVGRSATRISEPLLRAATRLKVVGRAGVGVDNIALPVATELGIAVINAPAGNTVAVAELFFAVVLALLRGLPRADASMRAGRWDRAELLGTELKGKRLGIVGLGRIGGEVATRALAFGMDVAAHDPYVGEERFTRLRVRRARTLAELLPAADLLTVHVPLTPETTGLIGAAELAALPRGAIVCNLARGGIVDDAALRDALRAGRLRGACLDVYAHEPLTGDHPWRDVPHVVLTPHIGASTAEAQRNVAVEVCAAVRDALRSRDLSRSVNMDGGTGDWAALRPALTLARRAAVVARTRLADRGATALSSLTVRCGPDYAAAAPLLCAAAAAGALDGIVDGARLNLISARAVAAQRGLAVAAPSESTLAHPRAVEVRLAAGDDHTVVGGIASADGPPRLTRIGRFRVDVQPHETLLVLTNHDVPGVIGRVGTALGDAGVNIAEYHQARLAQGGKALAVVAVDGRPDDGVLARLRALPDVLSASLVHFRDDA